jgi:acetyl-CoA synthetase
MLTPGKSYDEICQNFRWQVPERYNMAVDVCDRHVDGRETTALIYVDEQGRESRYSFRDMRKYSSQLAHTLEAHGVERGDRVGILLPQSPEVEEFPMTATGKIRRKVLREQSHQPTQSLEAQSK